MDNNIERSIVLGLTRIFSEYGWYSTGDSELFTDKVDTIQYGLHHGDALGYRAHLRLLIKAREKDGNWGIFSPIYVNGIENLLSTYGEHNDLFTIQSTSSKPLFKSEVSPLNVFKNVKEAKAALTRLRQYGKTNIRYNLVEQYGIDRLQSDLRDAGFKKGTVTICYDSYQPDYLCDPVYDEGKVKMFVYFPIMPVVLLTNGKKK